MDYQVSDFYDKKPDYHDNKPHSNGFALTSFILGIVSVALSCCFYLSFPCSSLAIIFALLSRGGQMSLCGKAKAGLILGIIGFALTFVIIFLAVIFSVLSY